MISLEQHAKTEIKLLEDQLESRFSGEELDYARLVLSELKTVCKSVFKTVDAQGHSGESYSTLITMLIRLLDRNVLTPLTDDLSEYTEWCDGSEDGHRHFQNKRKTSVFIDIDADGNRVYNDVGRIYCYDGKSTWTNGLVNRYVNKLYPISFPYMPEQIKVKAYDYLLWDDASKSDFDTIYIESITLPNGKVDTEHSIIFSCHGDMEDWEEISKEDFEKRKAELFESASKSEK